MKKRIFTAIVATAVLLGGCGTTNEISDIDMADNDVAIKLEQSGDTDVLTTEAQDVNNAETGETGEAEVTTVSVSAVTVADNTVPVQLEQTTDTNVFAVETQNEDNLNTIEGIAMLCTNGTIFILSDLGSGYAELSPISMTAANKDNSIFDGIVTGDKIKVKIGCIEESYPGHTYVYSLEKTGNGSIDNIPADLIAILEDMGYTAEENEPTVNEPVAGYPCFKYDTVTRITVIPEFQIPMNSKEPYEFPSNMIKEFAKLIEVCEAVQTEKPDEVLVGGGYIVTVYSSDGYSIEYNFWNEDIFVVNGEYYSTERAYGEQIINDIVSVILEADKADNVSGRKVDEITPLSKEEDLQIRTDYAAYVSSRHKADDSGASGTPRLVTANDVHGEFYFGKCDGYMLLVMCPSEAYTTDIGRVKLRYTDLDIIDPSYDCYPYYDIELPSGMFEMLAYKDGAFISVEKALETKLIDYSAAMIIEKYMDAYYQGNRTCAYNVS